MYASMDASDVVRALESSHERGLRDADVARMRELHGWNELPEMRRSAALLFLAQFHDVMVYVLIAALGVSVAVPFIEGGALTLESFLDAIVICAILVLNAVLGFVQEYKAEEAIAMLKKLTAPSARVRRNGGETIIPSREIVPGDIVIVEAGDRISADGRLLEESHLRVNESSLTGESLAVDKDVLPIARERAPVAEQRNMVFSGTLVTRGYGEYVVTATGEETEIGRIATLVSETRLPETPLQKRMAQLGKMLGIVVAVLCAVVFALGLLRGMTFAAVLLVAVSLAVSAVPEGLPAVVTVCLAMGVRKMARENAFVRRLESLETLGSVSVICADKTGTITQNRMRVVDTWIAPGGSEELLARIAASCNRAKLPNLGDPTEIGLLEYARKVGAKRDPIEVEMVPFSSEEKYMQTCLVARERRGVPLSPEHREIFLKGAPEKIVALSGIPHTDVVAQDAEFARSGLRVLACAVREGDALRIVGLIAMEDPPRKTVRDSIARAKTAGIRTIMITGDNLATAKAVAAEVGIEGEAMHGADLDAICRKDLARKLQSVSIFARVSPEHKLKILRALESDGQIVAMSGDGVNDAPALKGAHVGVAMGKIGTEVAREAASIVLADDDYSTIVNAVREGRRIYDNIRKFVLFLLRANFDELLFIGTTMMLGMPLPYLPLHILWINLLTDGLPALALGMEPAERNIMTRGPRPPKEHILAGEWGRLVFSSVFSFALAFLFFLWQLSRGVPLPEARTVTLSLAIVFELFLAFSVRSREPIWRIGFFSNRWMIGATLIPFVLQILLLATPLRELFHLTAISLEEWAEVILLASFGFAVFEGLKLAHDKEGLAH